jgi:hypothetical protein
LKSAKEILKRDFWDIFISNLDMNTTEDDIKTYLSEKSTEVTVKDVYFMSSKQANTKSAKIRFSLNDKDMVQEDSFWPLHIKHRDWVVKPKWARKLSESRDKENTSVKSSGIES